MHPMQFVLLALAAYLLVGVIVGAWFVVARAGRVDPAAEGSSLAFRLLILPGAAALWPLVLRMPAGGPRASDDPARRRTDVHRIAHRIAWPLLLPAIAVLVVLAVAFRSTPATVDAGAVPQAAPARSPTPAEAAP